MNKKMIALLCAIFGLVWLGAAMAAKEGDGTPDCVLPLFDGSGVVDTHKLSGKVLYLDFWASWCGPCAKSFPFMNEMHHDLNDKGLQLIGINLDENPEDAKAFLSKFPADFTLTADPGSQCAQSFEVKAMPSSYLIGRDGKIHHVHLGFRSGEAKELYQLVKQLLAESPGAAHNPIGH